MLDEEEALLCGPTEAQQEKRADSCCMKLGRYTRPASAMVTTQDSSTKVPSVAGKVIGDGTNGTRHSLPMGMFSHDVFKHLNHFQITLEKCYLCLKI